MSTMKIAGALLTASVADRILTYMLLPFGQEGRTSIGKVTASKGSITVPEDPSTLFANMEHEPTKPVAKFVSVEETDEGLKASIRVLETQAGNDFLLEASEGARRGISVEVDNPVVRAGKLVAGVLTGAGVCVNPAFPNATMLASDVGELPDYMRNDEDSTTETTETITVDGVEYVRKTKSTYTTETTPKEQPSGNQSADESAKENEAEMEQTLAAAAPLTASSNAPILQGTGSKGTGDVFKMLAAAYKQGGERKMLAALHDIVPANILGIEQPQFVGELWSGKAYERKFIPLFNHADLTSFKVSGWRWVTKPVVAAYTGNKTAVPSGAAETEAVTIDASRIAGAHDIDRKFKDFGDEGFFDAYYRAMTESYAQVSDSAVLTTVAAGATAVTMGTVPSGVSKGATALVDGALAVLDATNSVPTFGIVALDLYRDFLLTRSDDVLAYLNAALGLEEGSLASFSLIPSNAIGAGNVLVGAKDAATVHELPGTPIRVEAENIGMGGVDAGVFGYYAVNIHDEDGLALVDTTP